MPDTAESSRSRWIWMVGFGAATVSTSSEAWGISDTFQAGQVGTGYRAGLGMTSSLTKNLSIYGEADYLRGASDQGFKGWTGNIGVRFNF